MTHCCRLARHDGVDTDTEFAGNLGITHPSYADHRLDCLPSFRCDPPGSDVSYASLIVRLAAENWDMAVTIAADIVKSRTKEPEYVDPACPRSEACGKC